MGRAPCCEKTGLKKGPWTKEEDRLLINYINENGHGNWRALPKKAGLLRCGKSCRLRWTNYLRPDIKRGNFSKEEEESIIKLHQTLGNRWSAIAATLPGRTDNEIKNVWHTHLKKKLVKQQKLVEKANFDSNSSPKNISKQEQDMNNNQSSRLQCCSSGEDISSSSVTSTTTTATIPDNPTEMYLNVSHDSVSNNKKEILDQDIWNDVVSYHDHSLSPILRHGCGYNPNTLDDIDFWCDLFTRTEEMSDSLEF